MYCVLSHSLSHWQGPKAWDDATPSFADGYRQRLLPCRLPEQGWPASNACLFGVTSKDVIIDLATCLVVPSFAGTYMKQKLPILIHLHPWRRLRHRLALLLHLPRLWPLPRGPRRRACRDGGLPPRARAPAPRGLRRLHGGPQMGGRARRRGPGGGSAWRAISRGPTSPTTSCCRRAPTA